ncbi:hypothetical protein TPA0910_42990 [Streptomyces hygroscopicus subsp. sporocinereus]|uniref:Uncharacterized protein n=1 Tax=Streptomyces hygroscopicus TaxID=1912 RepID=A0ABQ3U3B9_STRHY|nr:hypothetical protein TPA0910_42990 [Streptomyces hygroscopicus]
MLMLQPPGRGSTYRYVLPGSMVRKRVIGVTPLIQRTRSMREPVYGPVPVCAGTPHPP